MPVVTFDQVRESQEIRAYIQKADEVLGVIGFTEHAFAHVGKCAQVAGDLLLRLDYDARTAELARIAGFMHDMGNVVNRADHAQSGALMAFRLLDKMGMDPGEIAAVTTAIGHHDEETAYAVSPVAAALLLADKSDVRRSRVRAGDAASIGLDIHDRVNYAVEQSALELHLDNRTIALELTIDTTICAVMDYFEIFLGRMLLCRRAANFFNLKFKLVINGVSLL